MTDRQEVYRVHQSDPALVQACLAGDQSAWDEMVERYSRLVYSIPRRLGLSADDADDVFQNVFVTLYRRLGDLRDQTRLSSWLITTTYRECWRLGKQTTRYSQLDEAIEDSAISPPEEVTRNEREHLVRHALRQLDDRCRELLTALYLASGAESYEEIARRFNMPIGSIGPTRARCFKKLEAVLRQFGVESGQ